MLTRMRSWLAALPPEARRLVISAATVLSALAVTFLFYFWSAAFQSWNEIDRSAPRIARLEGYELARDDIEVATSAVEVALQELAFSDDSDATQVGARLQQILRGFAEESGLTVGGSQLLPSRESDNTPEGFVLMSVQLIMTGLPEALIDFLREVYAHSPVLDVTKLNLGQDRSRNNRRKKETTPDELQTLRLEVHVSALLVTQ